MLDTPEAIRPRTFLLQSCSATTARPAAIGVQRQPDRGDVRQGRANLTTNTHAFLMQLGDHERPARCQARCNYDMQPGGPKGRFPGASRTAWGIPAGAKNKRASWEFIKWSLSKDMLKRLVDEGYSSGAALSHRRSGISRRRTWSTGVDLADLYLRTSKWRRGGYMAYRTVNIYAEVNTSSTGHRIDRVQSDVPPRRR